MLRNVETLSRPELVFLIHGVGYAENGAIESEARPTLSKLGVDPSDVHEFNWHSLAGYPIDAGSWWLSKLAPTFMRSTMRAFSGAIQTNQNHAHSRLGAVGLWLLTVSADTLMLVCCITPILWFEGGLAKTADRIPTLVHSCLVVFAYLSIIVLATLTFSFSRTELPVC